MANKPADAMFHHYNQADEAKRLRTGWFQLEQARTQELILRHIAPPPSSMLAADLVLTHYGWRSADIECISSIPYRVMLSKHRPPHLAKRSMGWHPPQSETRASFSIRTKVWTGFSCLVRSII